MPWTVQQSGKCPGGKPWGVINKNTGKVEGCHKTKTGAQKQLAALNANYTPSKSANPNALLQEEWKL